MSSPTILPKRTCVCGHHDREHDSGHNCFECGQYVEGDDGCTIRGCDCAEYRTGCQNCGEHVTSTLLSKALKTDYTVCSRRCALQLEYAKELAA